MFANVFFVKLCKRTVEHGFNVKFTGLNSIQMQLDLKCIHGIVSL